MSADQERAPIAKSALSIVLPAHNVAPQLADILQGWTSFLDSLKRDYEILLVDDGSSDGTADAADALAAQQSRLRVLRHRERRGFGAALRTGRDEARHPLLCYAACDAAYQPRQLQRLLDKIDPVDLVSGYRAGRPVPTGLRYAGFVWRWFVRLVFDIPLEPLPGWLGGKAVAYQKLIRMLFGVRIGDVDSAFKLFRRDVLARIPIQSDGQFVHAEILAKANFYGCLMDETALDVPATWAMDVRRRSELRRVFRTPEFSAAVPAKQGVG